MTPEMTAKAAWLWSGRQATVAGLSAAALLGSRWIDADLPAELNRRNGKAVYGIVTHRDELCDTRSRSSAGLRWPRRRARLSTSDGGGA